jgi:tripartite-type tricarboxylate transporter receptor subunit TctC
MTLRSARGLLHCLCGSAAAAVALAIALSARAGEPEQWPTRPVRFLMAAPAGSSIDVLGRVLAERMKEALGQPFVVENMPGAGGTLAIAALARASADGHTAAIGFNGPLAFAPFLYSRLPYDPHKDLQPVALTTSQPNVLAVAATLPVRSVTALISYAGARPGELNYASVGNGSSSHLTMELLRSQAGLDIAHVPYNGSPPALNALASGDAQLTFAVPTAIAPLARAGKVRMLAVSSPRRWRLLPDLPAIAEAGLPGFESLAWNGVVMADGTADAIVQRLNGALNAALYEPAVKTRLNAAGLEPAGGSPQAFAAWMRAEAAKWGPIIRRTGAKID